MWVNVGLQSNDLRAVANHRRRDICFLLIVLLDALSAQGILEIRIRRQHTSLPESMLMKEYVFFRIFAYSLLSHQVLVTCCLSIYFGFFFSYFC